MARVHASSRDYQQRQTGCSVRARLVVAIVLWGLGQSHTAERLEAQGMPPAPGVIPPNASRIVGVVVAEATWPPGSLLGSRPAVHPDQTLYSLTLRVEHVAPAFPTMSSVAQGGVVQAFLSSPPPPGLVGKTIEALLELRGDTQATRWWVSDIRIVS